MESAVGCLFKHRNGKVEEFIPRRRMNEKDEKSIVTGFCVDGGITVSADADGQLNEFFHVFYSHRTYMKT
jgi:hypothetical protein